MTTGWLLLWALGLAYFVAGGTIRLVLLVAGSIGNHRRARQLRNAGLDHIARSPLTIPVSVVIAARDDERTIVDTVHSLLRSSFPELEVIVVDDGSRDATLDRLRDAFELDVVDRFYPRPITTRPVRQILRSRTSPNLWVLAKDAGGRADALNAGTNLARYRYVLVTHGGCVFAPQALLRTMQPVNFDPGHIVGAGGNLHVLNGLHLRAGRVHGASLPDGLPARFQVLEYATAFQANRLGWSALNAVYILPAHFGVWRRDVVLELGGFDTDQAHEDIDFTLRVHRAFRDEGRDYRMVSLPDPVVWTAAPASWRELFAQRRRWHRALLQTLWRFRAMWLNPRYGAVGTLALPWLLLFHAAAPFIEIGTVALTVGLLATGVIGLDLLAAFLVLAYGTIAIVRIGSLVLDLRYHTCPNARPSLPQVLALCATALLEVATARPVIAAARLSATADLFHSERRQHQHTLDPLPPQASEPA
jgi:cellulose synthase/poly-beta-1,6-N-acetylglucosamine synthase-like glycosyltransferase